MISLTKRVAPRGVGTSSWGVSGSGLAISGCNVELVSVSSEGGWVGVSSTKRLEVDCAMSVSGNTSMVGRRPVDVLVGCSSPTDGVAARLRSGLGESSESQAPGMLLRDREGSAAEKALMYMLSASAWLYRWDCVRSSPDDEKLPRCECMSGEGVLGCDRRASSGYWRKGSDCASRETEPQRSVSG